jgi:hypothetical protein
MPGQKDDQSGCRTQEQIMSAKRRAWSGWVGRVGGTILIGVLGFGVGLGAGESPEWRDVVLPELKTPTATYHNVTVTARNKTGILIVHSGGVGNLLVAELDDETRRALGYAVSGEGTNAGGGLGLLAGGVWGGEGFSRESLAMRLGVGGLDGEPLRVDPLILGMVGLIFLCCHLFFSYCCLRICRRAGAEGGVLVWIPVLQMVPMLRAAGMSGWWFLAMFVPLVNLVVQVMWSFNLVRACGKGWVLGLLLLLPVTNVVVFLYLAFCGDRGGEAGELQGLRDLTPRAA